MNLKAPGSLSFVKRRRCGCDSEKVGLIIEYKPPPLKFFGSYRPYSVVVITPDFDICLKLPVTLVRVQVWPKTFFLQV